MGKLEGEASAAELGSWLASTCPKEA